MDNTSYIKQHQQQVRNHILNSFQTEELSKGDFEKQYTPDKYEIYNTAGVVGFIKALEGRVMTF